MTHIHLREWACGPFISVTGLSLRRISGTLRAILCLIILSLVSEEEAAAALSALRELEPFGRARKKL